MQALPRGVRILRAGIRRICGLACEMLVPVLISSLIVVLAGPVQAESRAYTPKPGSNERKAILDAARDPIEDVLRKEVIFRVEHLKVKDGWAFLKGQLRTKGDKPFDYRGTRYEADSKVADECLVVIFRHKRDRWYVVDRSLFSTDVWWHGAHERLGAPLDIFDYADWEKN